MSDPYLVSPAEPVTLEYIKAAVSQRVSPEFAESIRANVRRDPVSGALIRSLTAYVLTERLPPEQITAWKTFAFDVPASPWQQFKASHADDWWMRWLVARRPARVVTHRFVGELVAKVDRRYAWPKARVMPQNWGDPVRMFTTNQSVRWDQM